MPRMMYLGSAILLMFFCRILGANGSGTVSKNEPWPSEDRVEWIRQHFLALNHPLAYKWTVDSPGTSVRYDNSLSHIELRRDTRKLSEKATTAELIDVLWPYLADRTYDADACIVLLGTLRTSLSALGGEVTYESRVKPGNWDYLRPILVPTCKTRCARAMGQDPESWSPHKVLFDREKVLAESKADPAVRARYIAEMQKALADPKIRTENPLEVKNVLNILSTVEAKEAIGTFVEYAFYDWHTGKDYRRTSSNTNTFSDVYLQTMPILTYIPRLGDVTVPLVLNRFANTTDEERFVQGGGGATPVLAILYFIQVGYTEAQALKAIEDYKIDHRELTDGQKAALDQIVGDIKLKDYRPDWLRNSGTTTKDDWAAPMEQNAVPRK